MDRSTGHPAGGPVPASPAPSEDFDWREYLRRYPDLRAAGIDSEDAAVDHWTKYGRAEGRWGGPSPSPGELDWREYLKRYPDLTAMGIDSEVRAVEHWMNCGKGEGRWGGPSPSPEEFDWREYLKRCPDLGAAGIDSEARAVEHWMRSGRAEGRWGAPLIRPERPAYSCPTVASIYLRFVGALVCWDDAGNEKVLQPWDPGIHYGRDVWLGEPYEAVRRALWEGRLPFPWICQRCLVLRAQVPHSSEAVERRRLEVFQVEPSYYCSLDCPGCISLAARRMAPPRNLDPAIFAKILADFVDSGIEVQAFDFQGHGEPLMNRKVWALVRMAREAYPRSFISMTTNAHGLVTPEAVASGIDEVVCAIDGARAESYVQYRVKGRFDLAMAFMCGFAAAARQAGTATSVVWKYVLFGHNSSTDELALAQRMAVEAGIREMRFVFTRNGPVAGHIGGAGDLPPAPEGLRVRFEQHEPDLAELEVRLKDGWTRLNGGDAGGAGELALAVARNLERFLPSAAEATPEHRRLIAELERLAEGLPADVRSAVRGAVAHLGTK